MRAFLLALLMVLSSAGATRAGEVGSTLGRYASAGAGVGALLGAAAATIPYLQSKQPYDFLTGAGIGLLGGSVAGFILGMVDVANPVPETAASLPVHGLQLALSPVEAKLAWSTTF
jgi:hypothetical protein